MNVKKVPIELLDADPEQPRREIEAEPLAQLQGSISMLGLLQPIIVYMLTRRFVVVDGHRRTAACRGLNHKAINAIVLPQRPTAADLLRTQLAANGCREDLKPTEKAAAYQKLKIASGYNNTQLAAAMSVSKSMVTSLLACLELPDDAKRLLDCGKLPVSVAYSISRATDERTKADLIEQAKLGKLTRSEAAGRVSQRGDVERHRSVFRVGAASVTVTSANDLDLLGFVDLWKQMTREFRKAAREGLDASTFERVLADRQRAHAAK